MAQSYEERMHTQILYCEEGGNRRTLKLKKEGKTAEREFE